MYNDQYFDYLSVCDNDVDFLCQMFQLMYPEIANDKLQKIFPSDLYCLHDILSINYNVLQTSEVIGQRGAIFIKLLRVFADRYNRSRIKNKNLITNKHDLNNYLKTRLLGRKDEYLLILLLDTKNHLINEHILSIGTPNFVSVSIEKIIQIVYQNHASAFLIVHNHPSGDPTPSPDDIRISRKLRDLCDQLSIKFHDHIIVGADGSFSLHDAAVI